MLVGPACSSKPDVSGFPPLANDEKAIVFVGDILLADNAAKLVAEKGGDYLFDKVRPLLQSAGAVAIVGNHEGPLTRSTKTYPPNKKWSYAADPATAPALARAGFTHLSLANNHILDRGREGLQETAEHLQQVGIVPFGAGTTLSEAIQPTVIVAGDTRVAIVGSSHPWKKYRKKKWGATPERGGLAFNIESHLAPALAAAREQADIVVLYPHWGPEYKPVGGHQKKEADLALRLGADVIIGHHSHEAQGFGWRGGRPILWSLGNIAFGSRGRFGEGQGYGLVARMVFAAGSLRRIELIPILVDNKRVDYQSRPAPRDQAREVLERLAPAGDGGFRLDGTIGTLDPKPPASAKPTTPPSIPAPDGSR